MEYLILFAPAGAKKDCSVHQDTPTALAIAAIFLLSGCLSGERENIAVLEQDLVVRVIDGDTFVLASGERVRLIGIDAPEKGERCFEEAKQRLAEFVEGRVVLLERDKSERGKYGRLVRYVYLEGLFVNLALVEEGFAKPFEFEPDTSLAAWFREAGQRAVDGRGCLWSLG